jgi:7-carboxy-7-deazaguanine synthase
MLAVSYNSSKEIFMPYPIAYPIAEIFFSVQGEGANSGIPMVFVRLAGCTVGKPYTRERHEALLLKVFQNECTIYDGRKFPCDTDYRKTAKLTVAELLIEIRRAHPTCKWVSITGGEPLMYDLIPLLTALRYDAGYKLHLDTSGTTAMCEEILTTLSMFDWVVTSPKYPFIDRYADLANEIRILVDEDFKWETLPESVKKHSAKLWISPINDATMLRPDNNRICLSIVDLHPEVRISLQIHKVLGAK